MVASRKAVRHALGALLANAVTAAQAVYAYQETQLRGRSPIVSINSASSTRERFTMQGSLATFAFDVHVFVLQRAKDGSWYDNEQAENLLDDIEQQICQAVDENQHGEHWVSLRYAGSSDAREPVTIEGNIYLYELLQIEAVAR